MKVKTIITSDMDPKYETKTSPGILLYPDPVFKYEIKPGKIQLISCGVKIAIPKKQFGVVYPYNKFIKADPIVERGYCGTCLVVNQAISMFNGPIIFQADYDDVISIPMKNDGDSDVLIDPTTPIGLFVFQQYRYYKLEKEVVPFHVNTPPPAYPEVQNN